MPDFVHPVTLNIICPEELPCDPCQSVCPSGAITVEPGISSIPEVDNDKCNACGLCVAVCPGLAIFLLESDEADDSARVTFAWEYLPVPEERANVPVVDGEGKVVGTGQVVRCREMPRFGNTVLLTVRVERMIAKEVQGVCLTTLRTKRT